MAVHGFPEFELIAYGAVGKEVEIGDGGIGVGVCDDRTGDRCDITFIGREGAGKDLDQVIAHRAGVIRSDIVGDLVRVREWRGEVARRDTRGKCAFG